MSWRQKLYPRIVIAIPSNVEGEAISLILAKIASFPSTLLSASLSLRAEGRILAMTATEF